VSSTELVEPEAGSTEAEPLPAALDATESDFETGSDGRPVGTGENVQLEVMECATVPDGERIFQTVRFRNADQSRDAGDFTGIFTFVDSKPQLALGMYVTLLFASELPEPPPVEPVSDLVAEQAVPLDTTLRTG
jgi:hypothetical protein